MVKLLQGKEIADKLFQEQKRRLARLERPPYLAVILVGHHPPSETYVSVKEKRCREIGIEVTVYRLDASVREKELLALIATLNQNSTVDGILVQFPLPAHLSSQTIIEAVDPSKDVDGFHPVNMGKLLLERKDGFIPCTPLGILELLKQSQIALSARHVVIVGRGHVVGRPLAALLVQNRKECNATVTLAHSKTENLAKLTHEADIVVVAIGKPHFLKAEMIQEGAVVVDVGINRIEDPKNARGYRLVGDVDFEKLSDKCSAITPVPGGVGPMTVAMLIDNTITSCERKTL